MTTHIVVLPGGGYSSHTAHEAEPIVDWLETLGYTASVFRYPLLTRHPGPLNALRDEITSRRGAGVTRVGAMGFSAGGHLAGHAALAPDSTPEQRPDFAVLGYPITSMELATYRCAQDILLGDTATDEARWVTSLDRLATPTAPPMFLWHTAEDAYVQPEHSYRLAAALSAAGRPHALHVFAHGPHSLGLARGAGQAELWTSLAAAWLAEVTS
ncbi:MAG: alpha/beta hydrolase [Pseudonocardiaceae bacterium]